METTRKKNRDDIAILLKSKGFNVEIDENWGGALKIHHREFHIDVSLFYDRIEFRALLPGVAAWSVYSKAQFYSINEKIVLRRVREGIRHIDAVHDKAMQRRAEIRHASSVTKYLKMDLERALTEAGWSFDDYRVFLNDGRILRYSVISRGISMAGLEHLTVYQMLDILTVLDRGEFDGDNPYRDRPSSEPNGCNV